MTDEELQAIREAISRLDSHGFNDSAEAVEALLAEVERLRGILDKLRGKPLTDIVLTEARSPVPEKP